jgi:hypothetical protein
MKKLALHICTIGLIAYTIGCASSSDPTPPPSAGEVDVYAAGYESNAQSSGYKWVAKYWKNNNEIILSDGINNAYASSIQVVGNDVYVVGGEQLKINNELSYRVRYWKNNQQQSFVLDTVYGIPILGGIKRRYISEQASSVFVAGSDVYIAINRNVKVREGNSTISDDNYARYWKNETFVNLGIGGAASIAVSGDDVYVAGVSNNLAVYWKNGAKTYLTDGSIGRSFASSIVVNGSDVYVAGYESYGTGLTTKNKAKYWKNGTEVVLANGTNSQEAESIAVVGNDVYVAGVEYTAGISKTVAKYWKNGEEVILTDENNQAEATSISVIGNDVYVAGKEYVILGALSFAKYWKNGKEIVLNDGTANSTSVNAMVVIPK